MTDSRKRSTKPQAKSRKPKAAARDPKTAMVDAALKLAHDRPWQEISLANIADTAGLTMAEAFAATPSKNAILAAYRRRIDQAMLADGPADPADSPKDRLFEIIMRRFDALQPDRQAAASMLMGAGRDPLAIICGLSAVERSLRWIMEAADIDSSGFAGYLRLKGLGLVVACTARAWLRDETDDMAETMAALNKALSRAEQTYRFGCRLCGESEAPGTTSEAA